MIERKRERERERKTEPNIGSQLFVLSSINIYTFCILFTKLFCENKITAKYGGGKLFLK